MNIKKLIISIFIILSWVPVIVIVNIFGEKWNALMVPACIATATWFAYLGAADD